jgi:hypothetical protein
MLLTGDTLRKIIYYSGNPLKINRRLSDAVEGALQVADISGHYMGVYLRGLDIRVAEQILEDADIDPVFKHMSGVRWLK